MKDVFLKSLITIAHSNPNLMLLTADLGFGLFEEFIEKFPRQYLNVGVAEQNMIGVAAGLALEGYKVFAYSIANFSTLRCLEQIRNDICYHDLDVTVVGFRSDALYS
jgi:transketolase